MVREPIAVSGLFTRHAQPKRTHLQVSNGPHTAGLDWDPRREGIQVAIRDCDHGGRYGGGEFMLILPEIPIGAAEQRLSSRQSGLKRGSAGWRVQD